MSDASPLVPQTQSANNKRLRGNDSSYPSPPNASTLKDLPHGIRERVQAASNSLRALLHRRDRLSTAVATLEKHTAEGTVPKSMKITMRLSLPESETVTTPDHATVRACDQADAIVRQCEQQSLALVLRVRKNELTKTEAQFSSFLKDHTDAFTEEQKTPVGADTLLSNSILRRDAGTEMYAFAAALRAAHDQIIFAHIRSTQAQRREETEAENQRMAIAEDTSEHPRESIREIVRKEVSAATNKQIQELSNIVKTLALQVSNISPTTPHQARSRSRSNKRRPPVEGL
jgi:hypothetical protein